MFFINLHHVRLSSFFFWNCWKMLFHALLNLVKIQTRCLSWIESAPDLTCIPNILVPTNLSVGTYAPAPNPVSYGYILYFKQSARVSAVNRVATRTLREGKNNNNKAVLLSTKFKCLHLLAWNSETEKEIEREIKIWKLISLELNLIHW